MMQHDYRTVVFVLVSWPMMGVSFTLRGIAKAATWADGHIVLAGRAVLRWAEK